MKAAFPPNPRLGTQKRAHFDVTSTSSSSAPAAQSIPSHTPAVKTKKTNPHRQPENPSPSGIHITRAEGDLIRQRAAETGQPFDQFIRAAILEAALKLDPARLLSIPCPFCGLTDMIETIQWTSERPAGSEYQGDAMKCYRCEAIAPVKAWSLRGEAVGKLLEPHGTPSPATRLSQSTRKSPSRKQ